MRSNFLVKLVCVFTLICGSSFAQNREVAPEDTVEYSFRKIMIIPFEEHMYLCGIQSKLAAESHKNHKEIVRFFRYGVAAELQNKFLYLFNTTSLIHMQDTTQDLLRTYASIGYKFEVAEGFEDEESEKKKKKKVSKRSAETKIKNGQLVSRISTEQKFASLHLRDEKILQYLSQKYQSDLFLFLTEMDIENDLSDQLALANNQYRRKLKIHYAVINSQGQFISKGIVQTTFSNKENNIELIKSKYFPVLAEKLIAKLPATQRKKSEPFDPLEKTQSAK